MTTKSNHYTQDEMQVSIRPSDAEADFKPKSAVVKIREKDSKRIIVDVAVDDDRIPKLINGTYELKISSVTADHVSYEKKIERITNRVRQCRACATIAFARHRPGMPALCVSPHEREVPREPEVDSLCRRVAAELGAVA